MELRQLEHFVTVAQEQSFTRAAQRLGHVQSALSVSIQALERELDVRLFNRTTRSVQLTDAGWALLPSAQATLANADELLGLAAAVKGVVRGTLRIGLMQSFTFVDVPRLLGEFHRQHPLVEIVVRPASGGSAALLASLASGELDIAFVAARGLPRGVRAVPLASESLHLATAPGAELPPSSPLNLSDLTDLSYVDFPAGWGVRGEIDTAFAAAGLTRRIALEVADLDTLLQLVAEGLGAALLPPSLLAEGAPSLELTAVEPEITWEIVMALPSQRVVTAAAGAFAAMVVTDLGAGAAGGAAGNARGT